MEFKTKEERDKFIIDNMRLVDWVISHRMSIYNSYDYSEEDLKQIGYIGLIKATDGFDENRGTKFSSYAAILIYGEMTKAYRKVNNGIVYSRKILQNKTKIDDMRNTEKKTYKEIAKELNLTEKEVIDIDRTNLLPLRLNSKVIETSKVNKIDDDLEFIDIITYKNTFTGEMECELKELLNCLTERDRQIVIKSKIEGFSQAEIAKEFNLSQTRTSEIIIQSLKKMRKAC